MHSGLISRFPLSSIKNLIGRVILVGGFLATVFFAIACEANKIDWKPWEAVPVLDRGRVMPLDTFARYVVRSICGRENPKIFPPRDTDSLTPSAQAAIERLFPDGKPRKFSAAELLYRWTVEPKIWDDIPILELSNETLRKEIDAPVHAASGARLKHISPRDYSRASGKLHARYNDLMKRRREAKRNDTTAPETNEDRALLSLFNANSLYRTVVFTPFFHTRVEHDLHKQLLKTIGTWQKLKPYLEPWKQLAETDDPFFTPMRQTVELTSKLFEQLHSPDVETLALAETTLQLKEAASRLADESQKLAVRVKEKQKKISEVDDSLKPFLQKGLASMDDLVSESKRYAKNTRSLGLAFCSLYDQGRSIRVVPALDLSALKREDKSDKKLPPWVNLQTVLYAPEPMLDGFPTETVAALRKAFEASKQDYLKIGIQDKDAEDRGAEDKNINALNASLGKFTDRLRTLGETLTERRAKLDLQGVDQKVLDETAYPPAGALDRELRYNHLDPFRWSWILTLVALLVFCALAWGAARNPMLILGLLFLILGQAATCYGLVLRMMITKMVPITNMYETILFVGLTTGVLTVCVAIAPLLQAALGTAWRLTACPLGAEARSSGASQRRLAGPLASDAARWILFAVRVSLAIGVFYVLVVGSFGPRGDKSVLSLLPRVADQGIGGLLGTIILWIVGLAILAWTVWFIPRALPAILLALVLTPVSWWSLGFRDGMHRTGERRFYMIAGAAVALLIYLVGYFTPQSVFNRDIDSGMMPILRNNFWLTVHVLIITASYGAGALAWGIGNISAAYYLFGRYDEKGAPKSVHLLANSIYRMMQVAILLLAAGTITGAIWADVAWGRYWGWDPKEVWALITLLVYLAILHGRWARWIGDLGMAVGAVLGFTSIIMAWYGVNSIGAGLHTYGSIAGGFIYVLLVAAANWVFVITAMIRYHLEKQERINAKAQEEAKEEPEKN